MRRDHRQSNTTGHDRPPEAEADTPDSTNDPNRYTDTGRLTDASTDAIVKALLKLKIGDRESCRLFVRAMEYELDDFRHAVIESPSPAATTPATPSAAQDTELAALAHSAHELVTRLGALSDDIKPGLLHDLEAQDEMRRGYDQRYLDQLCIEVSRLAAACGIEPTRALIQSPSAQPQSASVDFVYSLVHMFEECFERKATTDPDGDFARVLTVLGDGIGIALPNDAQTLEVVVGRA